MSGQMNENLTQQFANFVQRQAPQNAEAILTDTSSPEIAAQREALARDFVKSQVEPKIDGAYQEARGTVGNNMGGVSTSGGREDVASDYGQHSGSIDNMTAHAGIKQDVGKSVGTLVSENRQAHQNTRQEIINQENDVKKQHADLENNHKTEGNNFHNTYNEKKGKVSNMPGAASSKELEERATKLQKDYLDGKK
jgi:conjugal transfer mating pair stabilization protein TraG